ncbi:MAG: hypothetical protein FWD31_07525 [Planctomycetaceae bacterium]|nr:hypothetical protein [Planctomycetaceae bacterium]
MIRTIHASPMQLVIAVTGGGSLAISDLLTEPGASQTVLEALVPYGEAALGKFLGHPPEQSCSEKTARRMAAAAWERGKSPVLSVPHTHLMGVGCTCSLAGNRPKRGEHRAHWAVQSAAETLVAGIVFEKGQRSRLEEERLVADLLVETIAALAATPDHPATPMQSRLRPGETVVLQRATAPQDLRDVFFGNRTSCCIVPGDWPQVVPDEQIVLPQFLFAGSFDPMHRGHRRMVELVREKHGRDVPIALEIAVRNVDKPPLDFLDVQQRITSIAQTPGMADVPVWLTRFPRFADKSDFFRGVTFVVGTDTLQRITQGLYYQDAVNATASAVSATAATVNATMAAVNRLVTNGSRFLCFARRNADGQLETAETLDLPDSLRRIVDSVPASEFNDDISSTQVRTKLRTE